MARRRRSQLVSVRALDGPHVGQTFFIPHPTIERLVPNHKTGRNHVIPGTARHMYWVVDGPNWHAYTIELMGWLSYGLRFRDTFDPPLVKKTRTYFEQ